MDAAYLTDNVRGLLDRWASDGAPLEWNLFPILADALEDAGYAGKKLVDLRGGEIYKWDSSWFKDAMCPAELQGGSWENVFAYAGEPTTGDGEASVSAVPPGSDISAAPFSRWDVAEVYGTSEGENDERNWLVYGRLKDGRYFFLTAGCDYTGWG